MCGLFDCFGSAENDDSEEGLYSEHPTYGGTAGTATPNTTPNPRLNTPQTAQPGGRRALDNNTYDDAGDGDTSSVGSGRGSDWEGHDVGSDNGY